MRTNQKTSAALVAAIAFLTAGCAHLRGGSSYEGEAAEQVTGVDEHSSFPSVRRGHFEQLNLIEVIDPRFEAKIAYSEAWEKSDGYESERKWGVKYDLVFAWFRESPASPETKRVHRNSVQDRILSVSSSRCNVFKTYLRRQQTDTNFLLGSATTVSGVLGAVLKGVNSSRNLAGAAGMFSGIQAEYNQQYYSNIAAHLIVQGIELRQSRMLTTIVRERQNLSVADYSLEAAVKDAIVYDGSCSTVAGLIEAQDSIKEATNPGLPRAFEVMAGVRALNELSKAENFAELVESGKLQALFKQATPTSSPLVAVAAKPSPASTSDKLQSASQAATRIETTIKARGQAVAKAYTDAQTKLPDGKKGTVKAVEISKKFTDDLTAATKPLPVAACTKALEAPAKKLGEKQALAAIRQEGTPERLEATQELELAKAEAALASGRVELLVDAANNAIEATAKKWTPEVAKETFSSVASLPAAEAVKGDLANLCK